MYSSLQFIELLSVLRIIQYSLLNRTNHMKVEALMAPPPPHITLNSPNPMPILANNNLFHYFTMQITMHLQCKLFHSIVEKCFH